MRTLKQKIHRFYWKIVNISHNWHNLPTWSDCLCAHVANIPDWCFASWNESVHPRPRASLFTSVCANNRFSGYWGDQIITKITAKFKFFTSSCGTKLVDAFCFYWNKLSCYCFFACAKWLLTWFDKKNRLVFNIYIWAFLRDAMWNFPHVWQEKGERIMYKTIECSANL